MPALLASPVDDTTRRQFLIGGASLAALLAGCGGTDPAPAGLAAGDGFPVTIEHTHGSTEIPVKPQRVVCAGRTDHDVLLALGIVPASVYQFVPTMTRGVGVWAESRLGAANPVILTYPLNFETIATPRPNLILNVLSAGNEAEYRTLSRIAPTVGLPPDTAPNTVSWQDSTRIISTAVFVELSDELVNNADADVVILLTREDLSAADALEQYPAIGRSTFAAENRLVIVEDSKVSLALSHASVLSIPFAVDGLVPLLTAKLD